MLPALLPGAFVIQQSIYLNLRRIIPSAGALIAGTVVTPSKTIVAKARLELATSRL